MQDGKVLTSGEGGAVICSDYQLYSRLQQLRADGRRYPGNPPKIGEIELDEVGEVQGHNMCLSEFQSAILLGRLAQLDEENAQREVNAKYLRSCLADIGGVATLTCRPEVDHLTYYQFCVRLDPEEWCHADIELIRRALAAELNVFVELVDSPLNTNLLYNPLLASRTPPSLMESLDPQRFRLPVAEKAKQECLTLPHRVLLGSYSDIDDITAAFGKVKRQCRLLRQPQ